MAHTKESADAILAEFIAKKGIVLKARRVHRANAKMDKRDPFETVEFQPDNTRIGKEPRGMRTIVKRAIPVQDANDWEMGLIRSTPYVRLELAIPVPEPMPIYTCHTAPAFIGTKDEYQTPETITIHKTEKDTSQWKTQRIPSRGQRPQVLPKR